MSNKTKNAKNRRQSMFLGARRRFFLTKRTPKLDFNFLRINFGSIIQTRMPWGAYRVTFSSRKTGRTAFAYGADFQTAYQNMIKLFYVKYPA